VKYVDASAVLRLLFSEPGPSTRRPPIRKGTVEFRFAVGEDTKLVAKGGSTKTAEALGLSTLFLPSGAGSDRESPSSWLFLAEISLRGVAPHASMMWLRTAYRTISLTE
jgi:hypothetical protein